ncbi:apolipoprotein N-acyltransferase [candidate division KSB1 bacterium]|nr:apolipoprotein N-acyltransferase [candidate division KSB1 bacterium]
MERRLFYSILTGVLISFSFPPFKLGFLAYIALVPFFLLLHDASMKEAARWSYVTGLFVNIGTLYWINWVTIPGAVAAILVLPFYFVLFAVFYVFLRMRLGESKVFFVIPFLWTGIEYLRSLGVLGFPWTSLAYSQSYYLSLIQYVSFTSIFGVSFWVVCINVVLLMIFAYFKDGRRLTILIIVLILLFVLPWLYGRWVMPDDTTTDENIRIAVVQGNIDPFLKSDEDYWDENFEIYSDLSRQAAEHDIQLLIWPETAMPCYLRYTPQYHQRLKAFGEELDLPLITGAHDVTFLKTGNYRTFNSVFCLIPRRHGMQSYSKLHLVPFGERVPFTDIFPQFKRFLESFELGEGNFSPGDEMVTFHIPIKKNDEEPRYKYLKAPVVICFESLFPDLVRKFVIHDEAELLIIITNDAWFKRSSAPYHHAQASVFRAIENRISIARAANTGISMFVDPYGRTISSTPIFEPQYLVSDVPLNPRRSFFVRYGNVFSITISILNLIPLIWALFRKEQM